MITSERQVGVSPEFMTSKSTAHPLGEPLFYPPTSHTYSRQKRSPTNGFFEELRPLFLLQKFLGIFPYHVTPTGTLVFKLMSTTTLYSIILMAVITVGAVLTLKEKAVKLSLSDSTLEEAVMEMVRSGGFMFLAVVPFLHCTEIWKRIQFINSWGIFQEEFSRVTSKTMDLGLRQRTRFFMGMILISTVCHSIAFGLTERRVSYWQYCITVLAGMHTTLMPLFWYLICSGLARAAKSLGDEIEQGFSQHGFSHVHALVKFKFLWLRLSKLTQDLGSCMGVTYAKYSLFCFGLLVSTSYGFLVSLRRGYNLFTCALLCSTFFLSGILYTQCVSAQMATDEVGLNFQGRLQELLEKYPHVSTTTHIEMDRFLAIVNTNPPVINFCGFVEVNRGLTTSLMSQTLTYLIVLMQINISSYSDVLDKTTGTYVNSSASSLTNI